MLRAPSSTSAPSISFIALRRRRRAGMRRVAASIRLGDRRRVAQAGACRLLLWVGADESLCGFRVLFVSCTMSGGFSAQSGPFELASFFVFPQRGANSCGMVVQNPPEKPQTSPRAGGAENANDGKAPARHQDGTDQRPRCVPRPIHPGDRTGRTRGVEFSEGIGKCCTGDPDCLFASSPATSTTP